MASRTMARAREALCAQLNGLEVRTSSFERVCRIAVLTDAVTGDLASRNSAAAKHDGGWIDNPETIWSLALLKKHEHGAVLADGLRWLQGQRSDRGGWGRSDRDIPRIPITALALRFLADEIATEADWRCVERLWEEDLASNVQLSYKGGFFLLCQQGNPMPRPDLISRTIEQLRASQDGDGGFAPWKDHPIGSDPWSTGICLVGLCSHPNLAPRSVIQDAVDWLCRTQLPSGLWACHFIDEGSAYAYWGLKEAARVFE